MSFHSKKLGFGYSCIRGKSHVASNLPNQDAVLVEIGKHGITLAVADGVGSQAYSQIGSHVAVTSVKEAFSEFENGLIPIANITKTIFEKYKSGVPEKIRDQSSTTCVFAYLSNISGLFLGQIGDGVCYFKVNDAFSILADKSADFANIVHPLNASKTEAKWKTRHFSLRGDESIKILLATDGVSADIMPTKEEECLNYYCNKLSKWPRILRNLRVKLYLKNWNVPGSNDDKTMIVFWRG